MLGASVSSSNLILDSYILLSVLSNLDFKSAKQHFIDVEDERMQFLDKIELCGAITSTNKGMQERTT